MKFKKLLALSCAALLMGSYAHAQNNTIVVTATRTQTEILKTPSPVDVVTQKQMQKQGTIFVKDALKYVPGVSITSYGAFGGSTSVRIMGLSSRYIKTLIDGIDVSDPSQPQPYYDFANLLPNGINRIEIVQGAQSGLYGANAVGGVINIITKKGKGKPYVKYTQEAGSYSTYKESAETGGKISNVSFYFNALRLDTDGISKMDKYNPKDNSYSRGDEDDSYHQTALNTRLEYDFDDSMNIGTVLMWSKTRNYLDNGWYVTPSYEYLPDDDASSNNTPSAKSLRLIDHFLLSKLYLNKSFDNLKIKLNTYYTQTLRYHKSAPWYYKDYKGKKWGSNLITTYTLNKTKLTLGFSQKMDKYEDTTPFKKLRYNYAGFGEILQSIGNLNLQATAREDDFKTFGKHFTYKLGANFLVTQTNTILKANFGTGFRAPSMFELYSKFGHNYFAPEKSKSWNFGLAQYLPFNSQINATYFKNIIKNRIIFNMITYKYEQVKGKTVSDGFEVNLKSSPIKFLTIGANYTYTASKDPSTGEQTARSPLRVYTWYIMIKPLGNKLTATLDGRYIGKKYDYIYNYATKKYTIVQTGKYAVFDFTLLYNPIKNLEASLTVKNIFDRFYEEVYGYSTLPRSVFATVSYKF